jgi:hypothetical protein
LHEVAGAALVIVGGASDEELGALTTGALDVLEDFFLMGAGDERPHFGGVVHARTDDDFFGGSGESWQERIGESALKEKAGTCTADLALTRKNGEKRILEG